MRARAVRLVPALFLAALFAAAPAAFAAKTYRAEQFAVRADVQSDGSVRVTETIRFAFGPDSFTYVFREVPERRTDGVTYVGASMDGVPMDRGDGPGQFEIRKRDNGRRRIVFHFAPLTTSAHTFTLTYVAAGVVRQEDGADVLAWNLLPPEHEYPIDHASADVTFPATTRLLDVTGGEKADGGVTSMPSAIRASRDAIGRNEEWVITLRFAPRTLAATAPLWQQHERRTRENLPLYLGLGALILLCGIGGFVLVRLNHRPEIVDDGQERVGAPPEGLPAALAGTLVRRGARVSWAHALGTLLDLARRGVVRIEASGSSSLLRSHAFVIRRAGPTPPAAHEQTLLALLFTTRKGPRESLTFADLNRVVASARRWKRFRDAVMTDMRGKGLIDPELEHVRARTIGTGIAIVIVATVGFIACIPFLDRAGDTLMILPMALLNAGFIGIAAGSTLSPLSAEGQRLARACKGYRRYLLDRAQDVSASPSGAGMFDRALPYAAAFGVAIAWAKHLQKQGVTSGPAWLGALAQDATRSQSHMAATIAMLSSGSHAGAQAGGHAAGGAGAAGGGASGAG